jgi:phosphoribosyl 1,2-cyclic phosphodiesterase
MESDLAMLIKYWGVQGSIPSPLTTEDVRAKEFALIEAIQRQGGIERLFGKDVNETKVQEFLRNQPLSVSGTYGGDTTCLEVQARDSPLIMIDSGSGIRKLGKILIQRLFSDQNLNPLDSDLNRKREVHLFLTHYHWDHIQGFPFFDPAFISGDNKLKIYFYGKPDPRMRLSDVLKGQQQVPNFPVEWLEMPCDKEYDGELNRMAPYEIKIGDAVVSFAELNHPKTKTLGYAISVGGKKFVCATDTEHFGVLDQTLVKLAEDADVLYYDAQYTPEEYAGLVGMPKTGWGHSTYEWAVKTALAANVKIVVLGHHEPTRDDFGIEVVHQRALRYLDEQLKRSDNKGKELEIVMGYQGLEQKLAA